MNKRVILPHRLEVLGHDYTDLYCFNASGAEGRKHDGKVGAQHDGEEGTQHDGELCYS